MSTKANNTARMLTGPLPGDRVRCWCPDVGGSCNGKGRVCTGVVVERCDAHRSRIKWDDDYGPYTMVVQDKQLVVLYVEESSE